MRVHNISRSFSGEVGGGVLQGEPIIIIRFQGCNLRCHYCDAIEALGNHQGKEMGVAEILERVAALSVPAPFPLAHPTPILITGGEPLLQNWDELRDVVFHLSDKQHRPVIIETNGTVEPPHGKWGIGSKVTWVVDHKLPGSGEGLPGSTNESLVGRILPDLPLGSWVKLVCHEYSDVLHALKFISDMRERYPFDSVRCGWAISQTEAIKTGYIPQTLLRQWEELEGLNLVLNVQIHKILGVA